MVVLSTVSGGARGTADFVAPFAAFQIAEALDDRLVCRPD